MADDLGFLDRSLYFFEITAQLTSWGWVDPFSDTLLLRKSGSARNRTRELWICSQKLWPLDHRLGHLKYSTRWKNKFTKTTVILTCMNQTFETCTSYTYLKDPSEYSRSSPTDATSCIAVRADSEAKKSMNEVQEVKYYYQRHISKPTGKRKVTSFSVSVKTPKQTVEEWLVSVEPRDRNKPRMNRPLQS